MLIGRKQFHIVIFFLLLLLSCRSDGNGRLAIDESVRLTLAVPDGVTDQYQTLAEAFMSENQGVMVQVESVSRLISNDPNPSRALAQSADIFPAAYAFAGDWQSLALDLTPLARSADFNANDFPADLLYAADNTIRYLPQEYTVYFVVYNRVLFDNAGLSYPTPDWTWEEFISLATQLTVRYGDFTAQYGWADGLYAHALVGAGLAEPLLDYSNTPPDLRLGDEMVVTAVSRYLGLFGEAGVAPTPRSTLSAYSEAQGLIQDQRVAMWLANSNNFSNYTGFDVGVVPLPIVESQEDRRLYMFSRGFAVSAATGQPEVAWRLLEYLSRQSGLDKNAMPARASVRQATHFWEEIDPEMVAVVEEYLGHSFEMIYNPARQALERIIINVLLEDVELSEALAETETTLQQGLVSETEPLLAETGADAPAAGRILFTADTNIQRLRVLAEAFEAENPGLHVEITAPQWTRYSNGPAVRSLDRAYGGRQADCFLYSPLQSDGQANRVLSLDALLEMEPEINRDDFYPVALNAFLYDGMLVALPYFFQFPLIGYDTVIFDRAGIPYPEQGWTLEEFLNTALVLTTGENEQKQYGFVPFQAEYFDAWIFFHAFGIDLVDRAVEPPVVNLDKPGVADALRWYVSLSETHGVKPVYLTNQYNYVAARSILELQAERRTLFVTRRGAMWWDDGTESEGPYATPTGAIEERQYATFPLMSGHEVALPVELAGLYISAETTQRQACWHWFTFLMEYDPGMGVPARRSVAYEEEFQQRAGPAANPMLQNAEQMKGQQVEPPPQWMDLRGWYSIALTRAIEENITVEAALAITQAEFELYYRCVIDRSLFEPTDRAQRLTQCADPASPYVILLEE